MPEFKPRMLIDSENKMVRAYLECAEWTSEEDLAECIKWSAYAVALATRDCGRFLDRFGDVPEGWTLAGLGLDFWLTRNGHGAGFWSRDLPLAEELTAFAKEFGEAYAYTDDNGEGGLG